MQDKRTPVLNEESKCGHIMTYKNWFDWILHTPFHWFGKRRAKCSKCGEVSYMGKVKK